MDMPMNERSQENPHVLVVGPDGMALGGAGSGGGEDGEESWRPLDGHGRTACEGHAHRQHDQAAAGRGEGRSSDEASRVRLKEIHSSSVKELEDGLAPELVEELERLSLPFTDESVPTDAELRIAQAQLVGWLEGLFHGIQTALFAQQMAARAQLESMRRALPPGAVPMDGEEGTPGHGGARSGPYL